MKLWEIPAAVESLMEQAFDPETGEIINEDMLRAVEDLEEEAERKTEWLCLGYKNDVAEDEALTKEIAALTERRNRARKRAEGKKAFIKAFLNGEKFKTSKVAVSYRRTEKVDVFGKPEDLPGEFQKVKVEPDKIALKAALKAGEQIDGARLVPDMSMSIK